MPDSRPGPLALLLKLANRAARRGPLEVADLGRQRLLEALSSERELVVLQRPAGGAPPRRPGLEFRPATPSDAHAYARDIATDAPATFRARLTDATRCFVVLSEGRIVHATWLTTTAAWTRELHGYLRPPPGDAYVYESYTRPEARGQGVYPFVLEGIAAWCGCHGISRVWVAVEADNVASLRAVAKAGFEERLRIPYRRRLGRVSVRAPACGTEAGPPNVLCLDRRPS